MFSAIKFVIKEHLTNLKRIQLLSIAHSKQQTKGTTFGIGWTYIKDVANFAIMIFFRYLMVGNAQIEGMNLLVYLSTGLIPWFFINEVLYGGVNAIKSNKVLVSGMQFPVVILPTIEVFSIFMKRLFSIATLFIVVIIFGDIKRFNILLFIYYYLATFSFAIAYNLLLTTLVSLSKDFTNLYQSILRVFFFLTPIIWSYKRIEKNIILTKILKLNPFSYLIEGFRDAFHHGSSPDIYYTVIFWIVVIVIFTLGCKTQYKLRKYYSDYM